MNTEKESISQSVIRRLGWYLLYIKDKRHKGAEWISSLEISDALGLTSSTVRQDISHIDFKGISKRGYEVTGLEKTLDGILKNEEGLRIAIVGAGNLGRAIAQKKDFILHGFSIKALFDNDQELEGTKIGSLQIQPVEKLENIIRELKIEIGIICVPNDSAQKVTDALVSSGIKGILNLTSFHVHVPDSVFLVNTRLIINLMELSYLINYEIKTGKKKK